MAVIRSTALNINKPLKWTSRDVLNHLQKLYHFKKFGHAGTLDPLATGVLLVLVGDETKKQDYYMGLGKTYQTRIFFGVSSETDDLEGPFFSKAENLQFSKSNFQKSIEDFLNMQLGVKKQKVPVYSATKVEGTALYKHARANNKIEIIPEKEVELKDFEIKEVLNADLRSFQLDVSYLNNLQSYEEKFQYLEETLPSVVIKLHTGKGFYVRSLARDLGEYLGTGAVMGSLIRSAVGDFKVEDSLELSYFDNKPNIV